MSFSTIIYDQSRNFRPTCVMTLHSEMVGDLRNSNFTGEYDSVIRNNPNFANEKDISIPLKSFYLSEMPQISFSNRLDTHNGAKFAEKLAGMGEGDLLGIRLGEISLNSNIKNANQSGGGFVPNILAGQPSFRIIKEAQKLNIGLKTRIFYDPSASNHQYYTNFFRVLLKLSLPAQKFDVGKIESDLTNVLGGFVNTAEKISNTEVVDMSALSNTIKTGAKYSFNAANYIFEKDASKRSNIKNEMTDQKAVFIENNNKLGQSFQNFCDVVIKDYIYREYITLSFERNKEKILTDITDRGKNPIKFILKSFSTSQSNQLYDCSLYPVYMDFDLELESLGVVTSTKNI